MTFLRNPWTRTALTGGVVALLIYLLTQHEGYLADGWHNLATANTWVLLGAVVAIAATMACQAEVMVVLLRGAGIPLRRGRANALGLAANAWSSTLPGGPAVSAAMIFREQLHWGASGVVASWYMVLSGVLAAAGMAILGLGGIFFLGAKISWVSLALSLIGLIALTFALRWATHHPEWIQRQAQRALRRFNRLTRAPEDRWLGALDDLDRQITSVSLPLPRLTLATFWSVMKWVFEIICLWLCITAIGGHPAVAGVTLAFLGAKLVGQAPITPGGLGPVDVTLTTLLVPLAELPTSDAVAAVIVFRMISFVLLTVVGWGVFVWGWLLPHGKFRVVRTEKKDQP